MHGVIRQNCVDYMVRMMWHCIIYTITFTGPTTLLVLWTKHLKVMYVAIKLSMESNIIVFRLRGTEFVNIVLFYLQVVDILESSNLPVRSIVYGSFRVNSTNFCKSSQVSVSNIAQKIPKITLVSIMKACQILGCNSEYFWRYSLSNFRFCFAFLPSRL